ncbi:MAG: tRNA (adenosine(37)-N6)-dimethylallyltransferase MiaA [Marinilabiliales bacterium]|nr:tRNA (adenosine(37)-N6)-dimethylallyltransferase MiaA [Marinilabiliales bacterium]
MKFEMLTILGPTATGKTTLAAHAALALDGEILSADSRQIYRGMDIGTGKDLADYVVGEKQIPYHLIDMADAGSQFNLFEFQQAFVKAWRDIKDRGKFPVFCGGSGLYLEAVLKGYQMTQVPSDKARREELSTHSLEELSALLKSYKQVHNNSDTETKNRAIRAIEIEEYLLRNPVPESQFPKIHSLLVGVNWDREIRRERITLRLHQRLQEGMIDEVKGLLDSGLTVEDLTYYGLEYKFITLYLVGELSKEEMIEKLNIAIHQFAKRQMTWFRKMEREGFEIHWLDGALPLQEKVDQILALMI